MNVLELHKLNNPFDELLSPEIQFPSDLSRNVVSVDSEGVLRITGPSRHRLEEADSDLLKIVEIIISKKGWFKGSSGRDEGLGKYMFTKDIKRILEENPDWIKTKKISNKFGL